MQGRRGILKALVAAVAAAVAGPFAATRAYAADRLTVIGHAVHKAAATTGAGGDVTAPWRAKQGVEVE